MTNTLVLRKGKDDPIKRHHPWIFSGAFDRIPTHFKDGDIVQVVSSTGKDVLALGFFAPSSIAVKVLAFGSREATKPVPQIVQQRIRDAHRLRAALGLTDNQSTNAFRLVNAEGDRFPGLIVDVYKDTAVMQLHHAGVEQLQDLIAEELTSLGYRAVLVRGADTTPKWLSSPGDSIIEILENNVRFEVDVINGQKTGFFLDQRLNREFVGSVSKNRSVLNVCSYTGGFSMYALTHGATSATSLDVSTQALETAHRNALLNAVEARHQTIAADCFEYLTDCKESFECIVVDPPAFAKHRGAVKGALNGYRTLNRLAVQALSRNGVLCTFSCSQLVSTQEFESAVLSSVIETGREARVLHRLHQAPCHPWSFHHPEGPYLKGLILEFAT